MRINSNSYNNIAQKIFTLRGKNKTITEIATILKLKDSQVDYLMKKNNIERKYRWITECEKQFIRKNEGLGIKVLAKILNRGERTISRYTKHSFVSDKEKEFIRDNMDMTTYRLAKILNRSYNKVKQLKYDIIQKKL